MLKSGPDQIEFGHVCEDPHDWEQRYEKKDLAKQRHQGQVATATGTGTGYWPFITGISLFYFLSTMAILTDS
jgi:hypothetical protein